VARKKNRASRKWRNIDLHLHTPASSDYQDRNASYLDILKEAETQQLDIIAFTDHNTVSGYKQMQDDIRQLELLESLNRIMPEEAKRLKEYKRLLSNILVLPGFEFTATFGFHILGLFPPEKPIREIEHLLLNLNIPADQLDKGSATVGATTDVLRSYQLINEAGGLVIAAHANSSNGVAMRGFSFGGQTKIAYTQDPNLHALEVTDLEQKGRRTTAGFFNGSKPEYPRKMHCIQGSDAHRLKTDPGRKKNLGVGERATQVLMSSASFEALKELFTGNDFSRTRPRRKKAEPVFNFVRAAQDEGSSIVQDFHESMTVRGGKLYAIIADVCAFANTNGGSLYVGISSESSKAPAGITRPAQAIDRLENEISNRISPPIQCTVDTHDVGDKKVLRILVPRGEDPPYAVDENKVYVRSESETGLAVRDEIVELVKRGMAEQGEIAQPAAVFDDVGSTNGTDSKTITPPRTGVEVVGVEERKGTRYYTLRDLRNGSIVKNVTHSSARRLWHYAITSFDKLPKNPRQADIQWQEDIGMIRHQKQGHFNRYDLIQQTREGNFRYFFGVTEDGIHDQWKTIVGTDDEDSE
jgi:hypothetical protein